ncbi:MAG: hypothetical protein ACYCOY_04615 [Metallibacterium sp.]
MSKAKNTSVAGLAEAGTLRSPRGRVRLLKPAELLADYRDGRAPDRLRDAAPADRRPRNRWRERKKRANEAMAYDGPVRSWPEIRRLAQTTQAAQSTQGNLLRG